MMPGRTQSPRASGKRSSAAEFAAQPVHAAIHLQVDIDLALERAALEDFDLLRVVDHGREAVLAQQRRVARREETLEHEDRRAHAHDAQPRGFLEIEHREAVGGGERARRALDAVAVRVRFDDRPDFRARGVALGHCQIVCKCASGNRLADRPGHEGLLCYKAPRSKKEQETDTCGGNGSGLNYGFYIIMAAQFFSSLADNALLVAAIALLIQAEAPSWLTPYLKFFFVVSYVALAPYVGAFADRLPKGQVMFVSNAIKIAGCLMLLFGAHPLAAYALVGLGAAAYSPAKYGILTEYLPHRQLVVANGWIEGLTVASIILGTMLGGLLIHVRVSGVLLHFDMPFIETGIDTPAEAAIAVIVVVYAVAALFNLEVPKTGVALKKLPADPLDTLKDFGRCVRYLWRDRSEEHTSELQSPT